LKILEKLRTASLNSEFTGSNRKKNSYKTSYNSCDVPLTQLCIFWRNFLNTLHQPEAILLKFCSHIRLAIEQPIKRRRKNALAVLR